jgi:hypothetical protein
MRPLNLLGQRFGRLVAYGKAKDSKGWLTWQCQCDCGNVSLVKSGNLVNNTRSCGCLKKETDRDNLPLIKHGEASGRSREYECWLSIRSRCYNQKSKDYARYGGRGIRVCSRWQTFELFLGDMGRKPSPIHSIDRKDNDGNYEPGNCWWATPKQQANNRKRKLVTL